MTAFISQWLWAGLFMTGLAVLPFLGPMTGWYLKRRQRAQEARQKAS